MSDPPSLTLDWDSLPTSSTSTIPPFAPTSLDTYSSPSSFSWSTEMSPNGQESEEGDVRERKRVRLACQLCKRRKIRCDGSPGGCGTCKIANLTCQYVDTGVKRGPPKGYTFSKPRPSNPDSPNQPEAGPSRHRQDQASSSDARGGRGRVDMSTMVEPAVQEHLLDIYFTHIHNIWPLLYKPIFHPSTTPPSLLLSMLSAASVLPLPPHPLLSIDPDALQRQAEHYVALDSGKSQVHLVQSYMLFSCRETNRGNKSASYSWGGRACTMALELGLHRGSPKGMNRADSETRSRTFWACYILDKVLAEETGRPFLLRADATTVPLPSADESDEFELWPPPSAFLGNGVVPVRSRIITAFNEACKLAWIVEQVLALDAEGPHESLRNSGPVFVATPVQGSTVLPNLTNPESTGAEGLVALSNSLFNPQGMMQRDESHRWKVERLERDMEEWFRCLAPEFKFDPGCEVGPPTQYFINIMYYYSIVISLHSRFIGLRPDSTGKDGPYGSHHQKCTHAAEGIVAFMSCLDRFRLLEQLSADVIHMLSHATLFFAYNSCLSDPKQSARARMHFQQCCVWLKGISKSWAPASSHRMFFEGLIQGEKQLTGHQGRNQSSERDSPMRPEDVRHLEFDRPSYAIPNGPLPSSSAPAIPPDIFRLQSHWWNELIPAAALTHPSAPTLADPGSLPQDTYEVLDPALRTSGNQGLSPFYGTGEGWQGSEMAGLGGTGGEAAGDVATDLLVQYMLESLEGNRAG